MNKPASKNAPRETSQASDGLIAVLMPKEKAPGIKAFGTLVPGQIYRVDPAEALRLVNVKRFEYATDEDRHAAIAYEAAQKAPPPATHDAAAAVVASTED